MAKKRKMARSGIQRRRLFNAKRVLGDGIEGSRDGTGSSKSAVSVATIQSTCAQLGKSRTTVPCTTAPLRDSDGQGADGRDRGTFCHRLQGRPSPASPALPFGTFSAIALCQLCSCAWLPSLPKLSACPPAGTPEQRSKTQRAQSEPSAYPRPPPAVQMLSP